MEEELNEHDLEERLYAMLHHVDQTQNNVKENNQNALQILENAPRSTLRRYWRTSVDSPKTKETFVINRVPVVATKPKEERKKSPIPPPPVDLSIFETPPQIVKSTIKIIEHENENQVILETSDEDEVIEVALPPKPTIMIESSDEDELQVVNLDSPAKVHNKPTAGERCVSASPVPSVVSSVSDEFIRGDCIALNISSRHFDNHSFDFSLHGPDLLDQHTPAKKKKKKKSKEPTTSTPAATSQNKSVTEECFATPKSKAKNKKKKTYTITERTVPNPDIYDSDSNQSIIDTNKNRDSYAVTEKSLPSADVYESDSSHSENVKEKHSKPINAVVSSDSSVTLDKSHGETPMVSKKNDKSNQLNETVQSISIVDLTENDGFITLDNTDISENIVIGNVTGFTEIEDYSDENSLQNDISQFVSTKIPPILNEDLDFNNLNGNKTCKRRRYSLTTLRKEMDKFYNESWGGENFNHREIQKNMSRDKNLWAIDPKDKIPSARRKVTCNFCNRTGHRDDACWSRPPVCYMCGLAGHFEPRCPQKICVNCGEPNYIYSTMCRNCNKWGSIKCGECGQNGHPTSHCPDMWRRYHNTIDEIMPLEKNTQTKKHYQMYCSGCTRRGHLIHTCKSTLPFSGLPINNPYVYFYRPMYSASKQDSQNQTNSNNQRYNKQLNKNASQDHKSVKTPSRIERNNKRQSKSPTVHETHVNKKRNISHSEDTDIRRNVKTSVNDTPQKKTSQSTDDSNKNKKELNKTTPIAASKPQLVNTEKAPDFIPITSTNFDKRGQIIQDNEVSDTSDVVNSARIYVTNDIIEKLKSKESEEWLNEMMLKHNIIVQCTDINLFLSIKGKVADQEAFQIELRDWTVGKENEEAANPNNDTNSFKENNELRDSNLMPKKRISMLRQLSTALNSLKEDIGDPQAMYKELNFLQNRHIKLLNQKVIRPKQVYNNRGHINGMFKKLNMVLLGQAGLADGSQHLNELYSFQEKLINSREKKVPTEQRKEIGEHFGSIFAAIPRDDYIELLNKFYENSTSFENKNKKRPLTLNPKMTRSKKGHSIPSHQIQNQNIQKNAIDNKNVPKNNIMPLRQKLVFYHQRLLKARPNGSTLKKTRLNLVRKLHSLIGSMFKNENLSSKIMKKMKKAQEQAQVFLANV